MFAKERKNESDSLGSEVGIVWAVDDTEVVGNWDAVLGADVVSEMLIDEETCCPTASQSATRLSALNELNSMFTWHAVVAGVSVVILPVGAVAEPLLGQTDGACLLLDARVSRSDHLLSTILRT